MIRQSLAIEIGGHVDLAFAPDGVVCTVDVPVGQDTRQAS
jgi:hypothetical protein